MYTSYPSSRNTSGNHSPAGSLPNTSTLKSKNENQTLPSLFLKACVLGLSLCSHCVSPLSHFYDISFSMRDSTWKPAPQSNVQITILETLNPLPTPINRHACCSAHQDTWQPLAWVHRRRGRLSALTSQTLLLLTTVTWEADTFLQWKPSRNLWRFRGQVKVQ